MCQFQTSSWGGFGDKNHTVMGKVNDIVGLGAVVVVPVEGQVVAWSNLDSVGIWVVTKNIAPDVDRGEVLDGRVVVATRGRAVVCRAADADIGALVDAVDPDALRSQKSAMRKQRRKKVTHPDKGVGRDKLDVRQRRNGCRQQTLAPHLE